ncbi:MAG: ABC transporter permease subunit [Pseudomonadota bacterium]
MTAFSLSRPALVAPVGLTALALLLFAPAVAVVATAAGAAGDTVLSGPAAFDYAFGTLALCALVGVGAAFVGAGGAALVALADFPGRRFFSVALVTPFAVPAYIAAYAYGAMLSPVGPVADVLSAFVGAADAARALPEIRTLPGAAFILTLSVYPYVYLAVRASLAARSGALLDAARSLGASPRRAVFRVLIPAGRAAFAGGLALALMETAGDYGVADYFGVRTLSTGVFRTWYGLGDLAGAALLAAGLFVLALLFVQLEAFGRRDGADAPRTARPTPRLRLRGPQAWAAVLLCSVPVIFGFAAPVAMLIAAAPKAAAPRGLADALVNTGLAAGLGTAVTMGAAILLATAYRAAVRVRGLKSAPLDLGVRAATLGYALPGAVVAVGVLAVASVAPGVSIVSLGLGALLYAYATRFVTAGYNAVAGGLEQIHPSTDEAARLLGAGPLRLFARVHVPLARGAVAAGSAIVFIDILRELPATLLLRPFDFETAATRVYRLASDERFADAAAPALFLIAIGVAAATVLEFPDRRG